MAQLATRYSGQGFSLRGEKDRFVLPPAFRKVFAELGDKTLCVVKHEKYDCLTAFGASRTDGFEDLLDKEEDNAVRRNLDFDREQRSAQLYGFTEVSFDKSGRFTLKDYLCGLANITDAIYFQGGGQFLTLWDPETLYKVDGYAGAKATCRAIEAEMRAKRA